MNYIVLDLEWDSAFFPKEKRFINQILQIGAVKLDENLRITDTFEKTVCSSFSKRVSGRFAKLTGITSQMMRAGVPFEEAVRAYNEWAGTDTVTMTWSNSDLFVMHENEEHLLQGVRFYLERYLDLQQYIQNEMRRKGIELVSQIALSAAAEALGVSTENFDLHTAKDDSLVCVALLQNYYHAARFNELVRDTRDPVFFERLFYKPYYLMDITDPLIDREQLRFACEVCGGQTRRLTKWQYRNRWFAADFRCKTCGHVENGRVSFRKMYDGVTVKRKTVPPKPKKSKEENKEENHEVQPLPTPVQR